MRFRYLVPGIALLLVAGLGGCGGSSAQSVAWGDGVYTGAGEGVHGTVEMSVTVEDGRIASVDVVSQHETAGVADLAFEDVPAAIVELQSTDVDTVSGATMTSDAIIAAVNEALGKASN